MVSNQYYSSVYSVDYVVHLYIVPDTGKKEKLEIKTMFFFAMVLIAEFFVFGMPSSWGEWTHGLATGVVGTCIFSWISLEVL